MGQAFRQISQAFFVLLVGFAACASTQPHTQPRDVIEQFSLGTEAKSGAEAKYLDRLRRDPGDFDAYYNLGVLYEDRGQVDQAEGAYQKALLLEPRHIPASVNLAGLYRQRGEFRKAIVVLNDLFDTGMDDPRARTDLAVLYRLVGDYDRSLYESSEVLKRFGLVYGAMLNAALVYLDLGKLEMALTLLNQLNREYPNDSRIHLSIGRAYQGLGSPIAAEREYALAISLDSKAYEAHNNIGVLMLLKQNYTQAVTAFEQAVAANINFAAGYLNLGIAQRNLEKYALAEKAYQRALEIRPKYREAKYNLALLYDDYWQRPDSAINAWKDYLKTFNKELSAEEKQKIQSRIDALQDRKEKLRANQAAKEQEKRQALEAAKPTTAPTAPSSESPLKTPETAAPPSAPQQPNAPAAQDFAEIVEKYNQARTEAGLAPVDSGKLIETLTQKAADLQAGKGGVVTFEIKVGEDGMPKLVPKVSK